MVLVGNFPRDSGPGGEFFPGIVVPVGNCPRDSGPGGQ